MAEQVIFRDARVQLPKNSAVFMNAPSAFGLNSQYTERKGIAGK